MGQGTRGNTGSAAGQRAAAGRTGEGPPRREGCQVLVRDKMASVCLSWTRGRVTAPYSPRQNGTLLRPWRTLFAMTRCLLMNWKEPYESLLVLDQLSIL